MFPVGLLMSVIVVFLFLRILCIENKVCLLVLLISGPLVFGRILVFSSCLPYRALFTNSPYTFLNGKCYWNESVEVE